MRTSPPGLHEAARDWRLAVAAGCFALMVLGAGVERRSAVIDRTVAATRSVAPAAAPPTNPDWLREMLTHD